MPDDESDDQDDQNDHDQHDIPEVGRKDMLHKRYIDNDRTFT